MKKQVCTMVAIVLLVCICMSGCGQETIKGTWTVKEFEYNEKRYDIDDVAELCGHSIMAWEDMELTFSGDGEVMLTRRDGDTGEKISVTGEYVEQESNIVLTSGSSDNKVLDYDGDEILFSVPNSAIVVLTK